MYTRLMIAVLSVSLLSFESDQAKPPPSPSLKMLAMSSAPDAATQKILDDYVGYQFKRLQEGDSADVKSARTTLVVLLAKSEVTPVFQQAFLGIALPKLNTLVESKDAFRITNALLVIRQIRSVEAVQSILTQATLNTQPDDRIRISAAGMLSVMVTRGAVPPPQLDSTAMKVGNAIELESSWLAASEDFDCLSKMVAEADRAKLSSQAAGVRATMVESIGNVQNRIETKNDLAMAGALVRGLVSLRDQVLKMPQKGRTTLAPSLNPILDRIIKLPDAAETTESGTQAEITSARTVARAIHSLLSDSNRKPKS